MSIHKNKMVSSITAKEQLPDATKALPGKIALRPALVFGLIIAAACLLFYNNLGAFPLFNPDEGLYAEPAREMLETGQYITTLLNYAVRFTKPPLTIWAIAASYQMFGVNEFAARFFAASCGAILLAATYFFVRKHISDRAAVISAVSLMTAPLYLCTAREAITDMPLALFVSGALMSFYHGYATKNGAWRWLGYVLIGLAIMTKGPIGLLLPVMILGTFHLLRRDVIAAISFYKPWFGLPIVALIAVPWFAVEIAITKGAYFREFILRENFQRFTAVVDHKAPWWFHVAAMTGGFFPWSMFIPGALIAEVATRKSPALSAAQKRGNERGAVMLLSACTVVLTLIFFSLSVSKLLPYTLPAFPALSVLVGSHIDQQLSDRKIKTLSTVFAIVTAVYAFGWLGIPIIKAKLQDCPESLPALFCAALAANAVASALSFILCARKHAQAALITFCATTFIFGFYFGSKALAMLSEEWEQPIQSFAQFVAGANLPILVYEIRKPTVTFYAHRKILLPRGPIQLVQILRSKERAYIISRSRDVLGFPGYRKLCTMKQYVLGLYTRPSSQQLVPTSMPNTNSDPEEGHND